MSSNEIRVFLPDFDAQSIPDWARSGKLDCRFFSEFSQPLTAAEQVEAHMRAIPFCNEEDEGEFDTLLRTFGGEREELVVGNSVEVEEVVPATELPQGEAFLAQLREETTPYLVDRDGHVFYYVPIPFGGTECKPLQALVEAEYELEKIELTNPLWRGVSIADFVSAIWSVFTTGRRTVGDVPPETPEEFANMVREDALSGVSHTWQGFPLFFFDEKEQVWVYQTSSSRQLCWRSGCVFGHNMERSINFRDRVSELLGVAHFYPPVDKYGDLRSAYLSQWDEDPIEIAIEEEPDYYPEPPKMEVQSPWKFYSQD